VYQAPTSVSTNAAAEPPRQVFDYDNIINTELAAFVGKCDLIGGDVAKMVGKLAVFEIFYFKIIGKTGYRRFLG
jgi:hypothetical protein